MRWAALAASAAVIAGCSVEPRSDGFRCTNDVQCGASRICDGEWCVLGSRDAGNPDAPEGDAFVCPPQCTDCVGTTCEIDCDNSGDCAADISCPPGLDCEVSCPGVMSCVGIDIDCAEASSCQIDCDGDGSCDGALTCSDTGDCRIDCDGDNTCAGPIVSGTGDTDINCSADTSCATSVDCSLACACEVDCGAVTCPVAAVCPDGDPQTCETAEGGCDSLGQCDSC